MLELSLIAFGGSALAAFLGGKVGYRMGAKRVVAATTDFFRHQIKSSDNDLKSIPALLARRSMLASKSRSTSNSVVEKDDYHQLRTWDLSSGSQLH